MEAHRALPTPECEIMERTVLSVTGFALALLSAASVLSAPAHAQSLIGYTATGEDAGGSVVERAALNNAPALTIPTFSPSADIQNGAYTDPSLYVRQGLPEMMRPPCGGLIIGLISTAQDRCVNRGGPRRSERPESAASAFSCDIICDNSQTWIRPTHSPPNACLGL
jgi:hypothetical protein